MPTQTQTPANSRPPADAVRAHPSAYRTEPAPSLIVAALGRYKWLILGLAVLLTAGGLAVGYKRKPVWSATASVQVGQVNPNSPGFYGFVQSATALATTYSRAVTADGVLSIINQKTGLSRQEAASRLTATPIPDGAAFNVIATGPSSRSAVNLANTAAAAMVSYEAAHGSGGNPTGGNATALYNQYRAQSAQLAHDKAIVAKLENKLSNNITGTADPTNPALVKAQAAAEEAQGHANALQAAYTQALESQQPPGTLLAPLTSALSASSDRKHKLELYGFAGLAVGLVIGAASAVLLEQRRVRRHYVAS
jgi:capsular polysaccharide biosynthesis protein